MKAVQIGERWVGEGHPVYIIAEIGINHNGDLHTARRLIDVALLAGCDAVKFQKRNPEKAVPLEYQNVMRETPWGIMSYMDYRRRVEFRQQEYAEIDSYCREKGIHWFASCWDEDSVDFIEQFSPVCYKVASASLTDHDLLLKIRSTGRPIILSTGMSTWEEIEAAVALLGKENLLIAHSTSAYPCPPEELNLRAIQSLQRRFGVPVGYSGHEVGLQTTYAAVTLGAAFVERHITLDRAMWGSDQAASVEPGGVIRLVRDIRVIEKALGDGQKRVYASEQKARQRLRRK
ncbi:MAG: N-acetylneuraminate synthase family protein [Chloroflexi bacterium]|nr:N-acetylneuraminate synthase family protein [Chloroflexota bacterium]